MSTNDDIYYDMLVRDYRDLSITVDVIEVKWETLSVRLPSAHFTIEARLADGTVIKETSAHYDAFDAIVKFLRELAATDEWHGDQGMSGPFSRYLIVTRK